MKNKSRPSSKSKDEQDKSKSKLICIAVFFAICLCALWARAFYVQILWGPSLSLKAERQYWGAEKKQGHRGQILDRNGRVLAKSVKSMSVFARPFEVEEVRGTAKALHKVIGGRYSDILRLLKSRKRFVWLARDISDKQIKALNDLGLKGIHLVHDNTRFYPQAHLAGQLLGFVGMDGQGLEGIEKSFDDYLRGRTLEQTVQRDASGTKLYINNNGNSSELHGHNLKLTIDSSAQFVAERALAQRVPRVRGKAGIVLAVDVQSGEILVWAHYPFFNPNSYAKYSAGVWKNRIALDNFEPGSTMKPLLIAAAMQEKVCKPDSLYFCENGKWNVSGKIIGDTHKYGWLPVSKVLRYSSNICSAKIGIALGAPNYFEYIQKFGLTESSGLPLPGESKGLISAPQKWYKVDLAAASFGQSIAITSLQLVQAYLCLLNNGYKKKLKLILGQESTTKPERVLESNIAHSLVAMMQDVVEADGTGTLARIPGVKVGGKTGTAQKASASGGYGNHYLASFIGFFPVKKPKYLILVTIDEPKTSHYGGVVSAPVFKKIGQYFLSKQGKRDTKASSNSDHKNFKNQIIDGKKKNYKSDLIPDLRNMPLREAVEIVIREGIIPKIHGNGSLVEKHQPRAGKKWSKKMDLWMR